MTSIRRNSCEDVSSQYSNSSSDSVSSGSPPEETLHYLADFLESKLAGEDGSLISKLLLPIASDPLQELNAKDVLEQELKMKQEQVAKDTMKSTVEKTLPKLTTAILKADKPSKPAQRPASPDSDDSDSKSGRRFRTHFSPTQLDLLESTFQAQNYPSSTLRQQVHEMTGIPKENIKVWFQNRRAREKRRKVKDQRRQPISNPSPPITTVAALSAPRPVPMTTMNMHWPEDSQPTVSSTASSVPRFHPYQAPYSNPGMQNRCNWYWANAYQPYANQTTTTTSTAAPLPSIDSFKPLEDSYPMPQLPGYDVVKPVPLSTTGLLPSGYTFARSEQDPIQRSSPSLQENFVTVSSEIHPWSDNVLASL